MKEHIDVRVESNYPLDSMDPVKTLRVQVGDRLYIRDLFTMRQLRAGGPTLLRHSMRALDAWLRETFFHQHYVVIAHLVEQSLCDHFRGELPLGAARQKPPAPTPEEMLQDSGLDPLAMMYGSPDDRAKIQQLIESLRIDP